MIPSTSEVLTTGKGQKTALHMSTEPRRQKESFDQLFRGLSPTDAESSDLGGGIVAGHQGDSAAESPEEGEKPDLMGAIPVPDRSVSDSADRKTSSRSEVVAQDRALPTDARARSKGPGNAEMHGAILNDEGSIQSAKANPIEGRLNSEATSKREVSSGSMTLETALGRSLNMVQKPAVAPAMAPSFAQEKTLGPVVDTGVAASSEVQPGSERTGTPQGPVTQSDGNAVLQPRVRSDASLRPMTTSDSSGPTSPISDPKLSQKTDRVPLAMRPSVLTSSETVTNAGSRLPEGAQITQIPAAPARSSEDRAFEILSRNERLPDARVTGDQIASPSQSGREGRTKSVAASGSDAIAMQGAERVEIKPILDSGSVHMLANPSEEGLTNQSAVVSRDATFNPVIAGPNTPVKQVSAQLLDAMPRQAGQTSEFTLAPEELGQVRMTLNTSDSAVTLVVSTERQDTLDLIRRNINELAAELREMGYDSISLEFSSGAQGDSPGSDEQGQFAEANQSDVGAEPAEAALSLSETGLDWRI